MCRFKKLASSICITNWSLIHLGMVISDPMAKSGDGDASNTTALISIDVSFGLIEDGGDGGGDGDGRDGMGIVGMPWFCNTHTFNCGRGHSNGDGT